MSPTSKKNADRSGKYYNEFIAQNSDGIFRIEFSEPLAVEGPIDENVRHFIAAALLPTETQPLHDILNHSLTHLLAMPT